MRYVVRATNLPEDDFVRGYLECAEWCGIMSISENDATGESGQQALELSVSPRWTFRSLERAKGDCDDFRSDAGDLLDEWEDSQAGHDFWLTRNRHGAGFWDRGREHGEELSDMARPYGESYVDFDPDSETLELV